ncbi:uncharacterized protein LOC119725632 [Patiria miniata]|uniref:Uncharacterized protein n=1 Tax=Patiria miniata TaxID=46514 RepID=A0A913ZNT4_PATMI|nr:uncharacterized protein LOC119725632 [Patiria miniata]
MQWTMMLVLLLACLGVGEAVTECYDCTSSDAGCGDTFDKAAQAKYLKPCTTGLTDACYKGKVNGVVAIRSCMSTAGCAFSGNNDCFEESSDNVVCCCTGDGCNSATTRQVSYVALAAMMFVAKAVF